MNELAILVVAFCIGAAIVLIGVWRDAVAYHRLSKEVLDDQIKESVQLLSKNPFIDAWANSRKGSVLNQCYIYKRDGDPPLICCNRADGLCSIALEGYALIPLEAFYYNDEEVLEGARSKAIEYIEREVLPSE